MTTQPEALRLADVLKSDGWPSAAAELRRLHAENEALRTANEAFSKRQEWWNERMFEMEQRLEALRADAERYRWLVTHPNEWRVYRKHCDHKRPFRMMRDGDPWGESFATPDEAIDAARSET